MSCGEELFITEITENFVFSANKTFKAEHDRGPLWYHSILNKKMCICCLGTSGRKLWNYTHPDLLRY